MAENAETQLENDDQRQRILVADDEASIRRILETRLKTRKELCNECKRDGLILRKHGHDDQSRDHAF